MQMQGYSPVEWGLLEQARRGDVTGAKAALDRLCASLSDARRTLLCGQVKVIESVVNRNRVLGEYLNALQECRADADTFMMLLREGSLQATLGNKPREMQKLLSFCREADVRFPGHPAVGYWRPAVLVNYASHLVHQLQFNRALETIEVAVPQLRPVEDHRCYLIRALYLRVFCLAELGRPGEARQTIPWMHAVCASPRCRAWPDVALSRILLAEGDYQESARLAREARQSTVPLSELECRLVTEAGYIELLATLRSGEGDGLRLAREVAQFASRHGVSYVLTRIKRALVEHGYPDTLQEAK